MSTGKQKREAKILMHLRPSVPYNRIKLSAPSPLRKERLIFAPQFSSRLSPYICSCSEGGRYYGREVR